MNLSNMNVFPKFIIETDDEIGDCLIISKCTYHKQLATDIKKVKGGGWWVLKEKSFIFEGKSEDFGQASYDDIKKCIESGNVFKNKSLLFKYSDEYSYYYDKGSEIIKIK